MSKRKNNPTQPLVIDSSGVVRFKANALVRYLLDNGGINMNQLAQVEVSQTDREQFAQLVGYSVSGFGSLSYASTAVVRRAEKRAEKLVAGNEDD